MNFEIKFDISRAFACLEMVVLCGILSNHNIYWSSWKFWLAIAVWGLLSLILAKVFK